MRFFSFPCAFLSLLYYSFHFSTSNEELSWGEEYINVVDGWFTSLYVHLSISFRIVLFCGYFFIHTYRLTLIVNEKKNHIEHEENPKKRKIKEKH